MAETAKAVPFGDPFGPVDQARVWVPMVGKKYARYGFPTKALALAEAKRLAAKLSEPQT